MANVDELLGHLKSYADNFSKETGYDEKTSRSVTEGSERYKRYCCDFTSVCDILSQIVDEDPSMPVSEVAIAILTQLYNHQALSELALTESEIDDIQSSFVFSRTSSRTARTEQQNTHMQLTLVSKRG
jgi:hypothetical protein